MGKCVYGLSPAGIHAAGVRGQYARHNPRCERIRANEEVRVRGVQARIQRQNHAAGVLGRFARRHMFRKKCVKKCKKRCNSTRYG